MKSLSNQRHANFRNRKTFVNFISLLTTNRFDRERFLSDNIFPMVSVSLKFTKANLCMKILLLSILLIYLYQKISSHRTVVFADSFRSLQFNVECVGF